MFKVGEYFEDEAKSIASYLRDAGFKVDIKGLVVARTDFTASLQGKMSEMKERDKLTLMHESFLAAIKASVEKATTEEGFRDLFLTELDPDWRNKRDGLDQARSSTDEMDEKTRKDIAKSIAGYIVALDFAENVINLNDINLGEPIGGRLDDPLVDIHVDPRDFDPEDPLLRERLDVDLAKEYEISIDESSTPLFRDIDEEFQDEYYQEYQKIMALGLVIENLIEESGKGKMDIEDFAAKCILDVGDKFTLSVDANLVAEEIARSLEKKGIVKMKGNTIKWKG
ncbi:MAG TPA: hypothetical protein VF300_00245 [Methanothrix sp.]